MLEIIKKIRVISKAEVLYLFPFGHTIWMMGVFFVNRKSPREAYRTLAKCLEEVKKEKVNLILVENISVISRSNFQLKMFIYPEGTRNSNRGLLPFKRGAFKMAIIGQVPIIPVVTTPYYFVNAKERIFNKGHIIIKALEPISTIGMTEADEEMLMQKTRNSMLDEYEKLEKEVDKMSQNRDWRDIDRPLLVAN